MVFLCLHRASKKFRIEERITMTNIRTMGERDIMGVRDLILQLAQDLGEDFQVDYERSREQYLAMIQHGEMYQNFVYCIDDEIVGFLSMVMYRSFFHRKGTALINELVVKKGFRNRHIGTALLTHAMAIAKVHGMDEIEVGVMKENTRALDFYHRNGFDEEYILLGKEFT